MKLFLATILGLFVFSIASAHGLNTTQQQAVGNYLIEFEYDTLGNILAGDLTTFYAYLLDAKKNPVQFDGVYIHIARVNAGPSLVANLQPSPDIPGSSRMTGVIKDEGEYTAEIHFNKDQKILAQATFNFTVDPAATSRNASQNQNQIYTIVISLALGIILGAGVYKQFSKA